MDDNTYIVEDTMGWFGLASSMFEDMEA